MAINLKLITPPAAEPVSLALAKTHCHVYGTDEDTTLALYISAAREAAEHVLGRSLVTQTWERVLDAFPSGNGGIALLNPPIAAITSVKYLEAVAGVETTMAGTDYVLDKDSEPGWLVPAYGIDWPSTYDAVNAVRVRYTAGYDGDGTLCPTNIKHAILVRVGDAYRDRESAELVASDQGAFANLLQRHRVNLGL